MRTPGLLPALHLVADTDLVATAPAALVASVAARLGLVSGPVPFALPNTPAVAWWAPRLHSDPGHTWFRRVVADAAARVLTDSANPTSARQ